MRIAGMATLVAALTVGSTVVALAEKVPLPVPAPKRAAAHATQGASPSEAPPRPPAGIGQEPAAAAPSTAKPSDTKRSEAKPDARSSDAKSSDKPRDASGFTDKQRALINKVSAYLSSVQTLVGDFVQVGPDGRRTEGQFYIQKPGRVRFSYNPPSPVDVVADGHSVVVRDRKLATQDLYPLSQTPLRFLLADHIDLLRDTTPVSVSADDTFVTVVVEESHVLTGTSRLMLMFGAKDLQLRQWTVTDPQGYDTTVAVYNLDTSKKPDPDMFRITYPERADPR